MSRQKYWFNTVAAGVVSGQALSCVGDGRSSG